MASATDQAEAICRATKPLPAPDPHSSAPACKGKRVVRDASGNPVTDAAGAYVLESSWCLLKPCKATYHCKDPACVMDGRRHDDHHLDCKVLCKFNSAAKSRRERNMLLTLFHTDHGRRWVFCTINTTGRDAPRAWLGIIDGELRSNKHHGKYYLCREVGTKKEQEHHHWVVEADVADTDKSHELHRKYIRDLLNASSCRIQSKPTRANTENSVEGLLKYLAKDLGKRAFDWRSNHVTAQDVIDNNKKYKEEHPEAWADGLTVLQPQDLLAWCKTSAKIGGTSDVGGFGNQVLWGIWERNCTFHSKFYTQHGGTVLDPDRAAIQWRVMHDPDSVDELDCATMLFGAAHVRKVTADQCHGERFYPGQEAFARDLNTLKRKQALDRGVGGAHQANAKRIKDSTVSFQRGTKKQERIPESSLRDWQSKSWHEWLSKAPRRTHRFFRWCHEDIGDAGESCYLAFLAQNALACLLASDSERDCLHALTQWMDAHDGDTPHIIAFDLTRADSANAPYKLMEMLSNGMACNLKHESRVMRLAKSHIVVVSNSAPDANAPVSADRWFHNGVSTIIDLRNNDQGYSVSSAPGDGNNHHVATPAAPANVNIMLSDGNASPIVLAEQALSSPPAST